MASTKENTYRRAYQDAQRGLEKSTTLYRQAKDPQARRYYKESMDRYNQDIKKYGGFIEGTRSADKRTADKGYTPERPVAPAGPTLGNTPGMGDGGTLPGAGDIGGGTPPPVLPPAGTPTPGGVTAGVPTAEDISAFGGAFFGPGQENVQKLFDTLMSGAVSQDAFNRSASRLRERTTQMGEAGAQQAMQSNMARGFGTSGAAQAAAGRARQAAGTDYTQGLSQLEMAQQQMRQNELAQAGQLGQSQLGFSATRGNSILDAWGQGQGRGLQWNQTLMGDQLARDMERYRQYNENLRLNRTLAANKQPGTSINVGASGPGSVFGLIPPK